MNFTSAERAGILLLPATVVTPIGAMASGLAVKKAPVEIVLTGSTAIVCVGIGLLSSLPTYSHLWPGLYGYEIIAGLALGLASPPYFVLVATSIQKRTSLSVPERSTWCGRLADVSPSPSALQSIAST